MKNCEMCSVCGKEKAVAKGMCKHCYNQKYFKAWYSEHKPDPVDRVSDQTKKIICEYAMGAKQSDLARKYGVSRQWVNKVVKRYKLK